MCDVADYLVLVGGFPQKNIRLSLPIYQEMPKCEAHRMGKGGYQFITLLKIVIFLRHHLFERFKDKLVNLYKCRDVTKMEGIYYLLFSWSHSWSREEKAFLYVALKEFRHYLDSLDEKIRKGAPRVELLQKGLFGRLRTYAEKLFKTLSEDAIDPTEEETEKEILIQKIKSIKEDVERIDDIRKQYKEEKKEIEKYQDQLEEIEDLYHLQSKFSTLYSY